MEDNWLLALLQPQPSLDITLPTTYSMQYTTVINQQQVNSLALSHYPTLFPSPYHTFLYETPAHPTLLATKMKKQPSLNFYSVMNYDLTERWSDSSDGSNSSSDDESDNGSMESMDTSVAASTSSRTRTRSSTFSLKVDQSIKSDQQGQGNVESKGDRIRPRGLGHRRSRAAISTCSSIDLFGFNFSPASSSSSCASTSTTSTVVFHQQQSQDSQLQREDIFEPYAVLPRMKKTKAIARPLIPRIGGVKSSKPTFVATGASLSRSRRSFSVRIEEDTLTTGLDGWENAEEIWLETQFKLEALESTLIERGGGAEMMKRQSSIEETLFNST